MRRQIRQQPGWLNVQRLQQDYRRSPFHRCSVNLRSMCLWTAPTRGRWSLGCPQHCRPHRTLVQNRPPRCCRPATQKRRARERKATRRQAGEYLSERQQPPLEFRGLDPNWLEKPVVWMPALHEIDLRS